MKSGAYKIRSEVWLYPGEAPWHFVTVPKKQSEEIKKKFGAMKSSHTTIARLRRSGWGSLPVAVTIGKTSWNTSIFPDKREGAYILPLKAEVRKKERVVPGETISFSLKIEI
ncbi:MAG: DUF1905 domain-containing protein [Patescibacteria group bacterium]